MKYALILLLILPIAYALPVIESVVITPPEVWLGSPMNISVACTNDTITRVYADINGPGIILPSLDFVQNGPSYLLQVPGNYFDRKGDYSAMIFCQANSTVNTTSNFVISELTGEITAVTNPLYVGDILEINFLPKKNGAVLTSGLTFSVLVDGAEKPFKLPPIYDTAKGWVLRVDTPAVPRVYNVAVSARYQDTSIYTTSVAEVRGAIEFEMAGIEKTSLLPGENITISVKALSKGTPIQLNSTNFGVRIGSVPAAIQGITQSGSLFNVRFTAPNISPGSYQLSAEMSHNASSYASSKPIDYVALLSGRFTHSEGGGMPAQLRLVKSGVVKHSFNTLSDGSYSGQITPDVYDVELDTDNADIKMESANVNSFQDGLKYEFDPGMQIEGFVSTGIHVVESAWAFSSATVTLPYDGTNFADESELYVFKCSSWDDGRCRAQWAKIKPAVHAAENTVTFSVSSFSAFIVGTEDRLRLTLNFDKPQYGLRDVINIRGSVASWHQVSKATVVIKVEGTGLEETLETDDNGVFGYEFLGPEAEGSYTVRATASKHPYISSEVTQTLSIVSIPSFSIIFPASVQVEKGSNKTETIGVVNNGQTEITNVKLLLYLDDKYYTVNSHPDRIGVGETMGIPVTFFAYNNDNATTLSAGLNVTSDQLHRDRNFGFTILESTKPQNAITGFTTGFAAVALDASMYLAAFAALAFGGAYLLKQRKKSRHSSILRGVEHRHAPAHNEHHEKVLHQPAHAERTAHDHTEQQSKHASRIAGLKRAFSSTRQENDSAAYLHEVKNYLDSKKARSNDTETEGK